MNEEQFKEKITETIEEKEPINPADYYAESAESWKDYWNFSDSLGGNIVNLINEIVYLPESEIQTPIAASYLLLNSLWCRKVGYLFSYGKKGTGKSTLAILGCKIHGQRQALQPSATYAALRNYINEQRWWDDENRYEKGGAYLAWDNLSEKNFLENEHLRQLMLCGYDRATEMVPIADKNGTNKYFYTFCPKAFSSIEPLHTLPSLNELSRRLFIISHEEAKTEDEMLDITSVDWEGLSSEYFDFWDSKENYEKYPKIRNALTKRKNPYKKMANFSSARWTITVDLLSTGITTGVWRHEEEGVMHLNRYWEYIDSKGNLFESATTAVLREIIQKEIGVQLEQEKLAKEMGWELPMAPATIDPKKLKDAVIEANTEGRLDTRADTKTIVSTMMQLGWKLTKAGWIKV